MHEFGIDCDFRRVPGYYYLTSGEDRELLEEEYQACLRAGLDVEWSDAIPLPFATAGGFRATMQAQLQPVAYLEALVEIVDSAAGVKGGARSGGHVFEHSGVVEFEDGTPCLVRTERGVVRARSVVLATHTPPGRSALHAALPAYRSYVIAFEAAESLPDALFWDTATPYHYLRRHLAPDGREVLIVGGKDHKTAHARDENASYVALEAYARERFAVERVVARWSAQFYEPPDGLPFIGRYPLHEHVYVATGFCGDGMTFGTLAAQILADEITGRPNPYAELYRPSRVNVRAGARQFLRENADVAWRFVWDRLTAAQKRKVDELAPGEGCIVDSGPRPVAVYRQPDGTLRTLSAVCPHLHCIVRWNRAEQTWDCPCHGARYGTDGGILEGPSLQGLKPYE